MLKIEKVNKSFGGVQAISDCTLQVDPLHMSYGGLLGDIVKRSGSEIKKAPMALLKSRYILKEGYVTYMMTPDKDFGQLVTENIKMYKPGRSGNPPEVWGPKEVCEKFGIERVEQVIDFLGMMGDSVDNIPGLPGVGEKTAQKLLAQYGSLENTLEHADEIKGKLGEKIQANKEKGILSKELARIILDVPIEFDEKSLTKDEINEPALREIFEELEFRTLGRKLFTKKEEEQSCS